MRNEDCRFDVLRDQLAHRSHQLRKQKKSRVQVARERDELQQRVHSTERRLAQVEDFSTAVAKHAFPELRRQDCLIRDGQRLLSSMLNHFDDARARSARERRLFSRRLKDSHEALRRKATECNKNSELVQQLTAKLKDREKRNKELALSITALRSDLEQETTDCIAASRDVQRLECDITELNDNLGDLRLSYDYITYDNKSLNQSLSASAEQVGLLEGEVAALTDRLETLDRSSEELTYQNTRLESAVATLTSEKQEAIDQNASLAQDNEALTGHITSAKDQVQGLTEKAEALKRSNEELTCDNTILKSSITTLTSGKQEITNQNAHLARQNDSARNKVEKLTGKVAELKRFNGELTQFNKELANDHEQLESSLATVNSEMQKITHQNAELDRCNKELADRITEAENQVGQLSEDIELLDQSNKSLTFSSNEMYMSNITLESDKRKAWHQNTELNKSLRTMTERCAHAELEISNITRVRDDLADGAAKLEQQLNDSKDLVERLRGRTGILEGRVSELEDRNDKDRADQRRGLMEKQRYLEDRVSWFEGRLRDCEQEVMVKDNRSRELARHYMQQTAEQRSWYTNELQRVKRMKAAAAAHSRSPSLALKRLAMQFSADLREADLNAQRDQQVIAKLAGLMEKLCCAYESEIEKAERYEAMMEQTAVRLKRLLKAKFGKNTSSTVISMA